MRLFDVLSCTAYTPAGIAPKSKDTVEPVDLSDLTSFPSVEYTVTMYALLS